LASGWIITTTIEGNLAADLLQVQRAVIMGAIHSCDDGREGRLSPNAQAKALRRRSAALRSAAAGNNERQRDERQHRQYHRRYRDPDFPGSVRTRHRK